MTKVKLKKPVVMINRHGKEEGLQVTKRRNRAWHPPQKQDDGSFVECDEPEFVYVPWVPGTVIEMSEASAAKYVESGRAEYVEEVTEEA